MKQFINSWIPPIVLQILRPTIPSSKVYRTYQDSLQNCPKDGYEAEQIVQVVIKKNAVFKESVRKSLNFDLGTLRTLIRVGIAKTNNSLRVIDFGGGGGYHCTVAKAALGSDFNLNWNIVETSAMVRDAKSPTNSELNFLTLLRMHKHT